MPDLSPGTTTDEHGRPLDQIRLVGITQYGYHGVLDFERVEGQPFIADVTVHLDTRRAAASDDLTLTLDYGVLASQVAEILSAAPVNLIETVAEQIAAVVLDYVGVGAVDVYLHKPKAPISVPFEDVVIAIRRDRVKLPAARYERPPPEVEAASESLREASTATAVMAAVPSGAHHETQTAAVPVHHDAAPVTPAPPPDRMDVVPDAPVQAVLALGANMGEATATLRQAILDLDSLADIDVTAVAPLARTVAVGGVEQDDFFNTVLLVTTGLSPRALLHACQAIEREHGRVRDLRWGPRTLDIDVIKYDNLIAASDDLELPHPRAHERAFVLQPWAQIEPGANLPGLGGGPVDALAATAPDAGGIRWFALDWLDADADADDDAADDDAGENAEADDAADRHATDHHAGASGEDGHGAFGALPSAIAPDVASPSGSVGGPGGETVPDLERR